MALDFPAAGAALWRLYDATGIRPEYALSSLWVESSFNPAADNGAGYYGLNQENGGYLSQNGIDPDDYKTWPASAQIDHVVSPSWRSMIASVGQVPHSGARLEQMNFLPATLKTTRSLTDTVTAAPSAYYRDNAAAFDPLRSGKITVQGVANFVSRSIPHIQSAIAQTYALRPSEAPKDPVYGTDFPSAALSNGWSAGEWLLFLAAAGITTVTAANVLTRKRR